MSAAHRLRPRSWGARFGLAVACVWVFTALFAPWLSPHSPDAIDLTRELSRPTSGHPLGTGENGIDVLTHVLHGARVSLEVSFFAVVLSAAVGITLGGIAGYAGGFVDEALMRLVDVLLAFPGILLALFITAVLGPSLANVVFALSFTGWTGYARLTDARPGAHPARAADYVQAAPGPGQRTGPHPRCAPAAQRGGGRSSCRRPSRCRAPSSRRRP
ncbi:ABC transporter permease [Corallococcus sp. 4LFB]|uniref:ABC transporter permease n=1 Tax=Corallococcus sp. 4LFB TaxID=3383249 RepID=UPI003974FFFF